MALSHVNSLFSGKKSIRQLTEADLISWLDLNQQLMEDILCGKVHSWRHDIQMKGPPNKRQGLKYLPLGILKGDQLDCIGLHLSKVFAKGSASRFSYVNSVLVPEATIYLAMEFYQIGYLEAETRVQKPYEDTVILPDSCDDDRASSLLNKTKEIQARRKRKKSGSPLAAPVTLSLMKKSKSGAFVRDGVAVELVLDRGDEYEDVLDKASEEIDFPNVPAGHHLTLLTSGGAVIPKKVDWTIGGYLRQMHKAPTQIRLGIGVIKKTLAGVGSESVSSGVFSGETSRALSVQDAAENDLDQPQPPCVQSSDSDSDFESLVRIYGKSSKKKTKVVAQPSERASRHPAVKPKPGQCMEFLAKELAESTRNYGRTSIIGKGGYGTVYKGSLRYSTVAIKVLSQEGRQALLRKKPADQFQNEVSALSRFRHPNILQLFGFCAKPAALIFEYMPNGSLHLQLHENVGVNLEWEKRKSILVDACRGMVYLHTATPPRVHQDIKSANILLDETFKAKLGDFGFSVELPHISGGATLFTAASIARSEGYYPSEITSGKYSDRSDVYSFGVVVLETYTGQLVYDAERDDPKLVDHLEEELKSLQRFQTISDPVLETIPPEASDVCYKAVTACLCRHSTRPPSTEVLQMLQ